MAAEVVTAATQNRLDPDLLFALAAVESNFDTTAVSRKGARGLGQVMFPTARAVAPALVHGPEDLYDVRRNLAVTARYLRELLTAGGGDLRVALTMYHRGPHDQHPPRHGDDRYVGLISTYYASLKVKRRYGDMVAMSARTPGRPED
jgi:soluble lytic murein transglycosylase-like protein